MDHDAAKAALFRAKGQLKRTEAVTRALELGMNLTEIEDYLDWIDATKPTAATQPKPSWLAGLLETVKAWAFPHRRLSPDPTHAARSQSTPPPSRS